MRKLNLKNKLFIFIFSIIVLGIVFILIESVKLSKKDDGSESIYTVSTNSVIYAEDSSLIDTSSGGEIKKHWNNDYYFVSNDNRNVDIGLKSIVYEKAVEKVYIFGDNYNILSDGDLIKNVDKTKGVKINGIKANFIIAAICCAVKKLGINNLETFDVRLQKFIPIRNIAQQKGIHNSSGLEYNLIENEEKVFMDVDITKERYELEDLEECVLPHIEKEKKLYLSGRMPHWLLASICYSYDINSIYTFQPGKGFVCVSSKDENNLGKVEERIEGIDTGKYFDDKKKRKANNYSAMSTKKDEEVK